MHFDQDIELDFIREFSVHGDVLRSANVDDRRERIRIAIYTHNLAHKPFRDSGMDYATAYQRCYHRPLELRCKVKAQTEAKKG
jgi:hypothetical protein